MSAPSSGLWGIIAAGHCLGQRHHGGKTGRGGGEGWQDQRSLPHLLHAGEVSVWGVEEEEGAGKRNYVSTQVLFNMFLFTIFKIFDLFLSSPFLSMFAQIGHMSGPSHQNRSFARGRIPGKNISAQPCAKVKLFICWWVCNVCLNVILECTGCVYLHTLILYTIVSFAYTTMLPLICNKYPHLLNFSGSKSKSAEE